MNELMDIAPPGDFMDRISSVAAGNPRVSRVEKCLVRKSGNEYLVDMHIEVDPEMTVASAHQIAHEVKDEVRRQIPSVRDVLVHVEPAGQSWTRNG